MIKNCVSMYILTTQIEIMHRLLIRLVFEVIYDHSAIHLRSFANIYVILWNAKAV